VEPLFKGGKLLVDGEEAQEHPNTSWKTQNCGRYCIPQPSDWSGRDPGDA